MPDSKVIYVLFNRRRVGKVENGLVYLRDINAHVWEFSKEYMTEYHFRFDALIEEIDYDEEREEILAIRHARGSWAAESEVRRYTPSPQVAAYLERSGITYEDIYGANVDLKGLFDIMWGSS